VRASRDEIAASEGGISQPPAPLPDIRLAEIRQRRPVRPLVRQCHRRISRVRKRAKKAVSSVYFSSSLLTARQ
jgi:hypothetical protein